jgi:hypothetical protein
MHLPHYLYKINDNFLDYEFVSVGPKGGIKKIIRFTQITTNLFNLGFGDLDEKTGEINDIKVTNNNDSRKVLATVASVVQDFTLKNNKAWIGAKGSTRSRTRLYQMGIANHWSAINSEFFVFGLQDGSWQPFKLQNQYDAFLIHRK